MKYKRISIIILTGLFVFLLPPYVQAANTKDITFFAQDGSFSAELIPEDAEDIIHLKATGTFSTGGIEIILDKSLNSMFFPDYFEPGSMPASTFTIINSTGYAYKITDYQVTAANDVALLAVLSFSFDQDIREIQTGISPVTFNEYLSKTPENKELVSQITYGDIGQQKTFNTWAYMTELAGNEYMNKTATVTFEFTLEREIPPESSTQPPAELPAGPLDESLPQPPTGEISEIKQPLAETSEENSPQTGDSGYVIPSISLLMATILYFCVLRFIPNKK